LNESVLTQVESGARAVSDELLEVVLRAAGYRPSLPLAMQADKILACAESHGLSNLRVFGSSVRGEDDFDSDIDLLVTPSTSTDLFDLALFVDDSATNIAAAREVGLRTIHHPADAGGELLRREVAQALTPTASAPQG